MLELVVASGKGGVGKSTLTSTIALYLAKKGYRVIAVDADADAPNLHLIYGITSWDYEEDYIGSHIAIIDYNKCTGCGECARVCPYNAIELVNNKYVIDEIICEGCLTCSLVCPEKAIRRRRVSSGKIRIAKTRYGFQLVSAKLSVGRPNSGKLVSELKEIARSMANEDTVIVVDAAAGIGCQVISSLAGAHAVILVTEPTPAGLSDLKRVHAIVKQFLQPSGIVVNKYDLNKEYTKYIIDYARSEEMDVLGLIPYDEHVPKSMAYMKPLIELYPESPAAKALLEISEKIEERIIRNWREWLSKHRPRKPSPYKPIILKPPIMKT